ncbi:MAG: class I SAM-dependent methyltransferase [Candidatus Omnitrophota bacterium]
MIRTEPILSDKELNEYYHQQYYGNKQEKFIPLVEKILDKVNCKIVHTITSSLSNRNNDPSFKVLDIGCGRSKLLTKLRHIGYECYGIEKTNLPIKNAGNNIRLYSKDLEKIKFEDSFFETAIMWYSLEHMANPISAIKEIQRIIKPNGILVVAVPNFASLQSTLFKDSWFHLDIPRHTYHFTKNSIEDCLIKNGFNVKFFGCPSITQHVYGFIQSFFNKLYPSKNNDFYELLKNPMGLLSILKLLLWSGLSGFVLPFAIIDFLISLISKNTALIYMVAKKTGAYQPLLNNSSRPTSSKLNSLENL